MGRYIYEQGNFVWKYGFAKQNSEQYLIAEDLGIGEIVKQDEFGDTLRLERKDLTSLKQALNPYLEMIKHYGEFVDKLTPDGLVNTRQEKILDIWLDENNYNEVFFWIMVKIFVRYIEKSKRRRVFYFEGEY